MSVNEVISVLLSVKEYFKSSEVVKEAIDIAINVLLEKIKNDKNSSN